MAKQPTAQPPLRSLVDEIKLRYSLKGEIITDEGIAEKVGRNKWWLSSLLSQEQKGLDIPDKTIPLIREKFKRMLTDVAIKAPQEKFISVLLEKTSRLESIVALLLDVYMKSLPAVAQKEVMAIIEADEELRLDELQAKGLS